jgi:hypothetical protein
VNSPRAAASFGIDLDRVGRLENLRDGLRRRLAGRYPVDAFGADPAFQDLVLGPLAPLLSVEVTGPVPPAGPAVIVADEGPARLAGPALVLAIRRAHRRRVRVCGYPDVVLLADVCRRFGFVRHRADDLASVLRAGHLAVVLRRDDDEVDARMLTPAVEHLVLPAVVRFGIVHARPGISVVVGEPLPGWAPGDPLAAPDLVAALRARLAALRVEQVDGAPVVSLPGR